MKINQHKPIILASGSPRRKDYLERYGLDFTIITSDVDETVNPNELPQDFSERMAEEKARDVELKCESSEGVIIAADTIVVLKDKILGKPESQKMVFPMLRELNGDQHQVITSYFVLDCRDGKQVKKSVKTTVQFNNLPENFLLAYANSSEPLDKAGAYSVQGIGTILVKSINGSYNNVVGLPIEELLIDLVSIGAISI